MECELCGTPLPEVRISKNRLSTARRCRGCRFVGRKSASTHGHSTGGHSRTYRSWHSMRQRCGNPNHLNYAGYGGRGIAICARWAKFENFLFDMGERPDGKSLDRIDNDGNYEPGNCCWSTQKEQTQHMRKTLWVTYKGQRLSLSELSDKLGIDRYTLRRRVLGLNWPEEHWADAPRKVKRHFHD